MPKSLSFELKRKAVHLLALLYIALYIALAHAASKEIALLVLAALLLAFLLFEFVRIKQHHFPAFLARFWRAREAKKLGGHIYMLLGVIIAFAVCAQAIAITAILMTVFGDLAAALIGIRFGRHWFSLAPGRAWEGIIAEFVVDIAIALLLLQSWPLALAMALAATLVETFCTYVDDNLMIPLAAGVVGQLLSFAL